MQLPFTEPVAKGNNYLDTARFVEILNVDSPFTCPEMCTEPRTPIHFYYRLIRLAPISIYKLCTSYLQATYKLLAAIVTLVTGEF